MKSRVVNLFTEVWRPSWKQRYQAGTSNVEGATHASAVVTCKCSRRSIHRGMRKALGYEYVHVISRIDLL